MIQIKKFTNVSYQTSNSPECKISKENEATKKETIVILEKLEKAEEIITEVKPLLEKINKIKETESTNIETIENKPEPKILKQGKNAFTITPPSNFLRINESLCFIDALRSNYPTSRK